MKYEVTVSREGKWWVAVVNGVNGAATEVTQLSDLEIEVRDLLAGLLDADEDDFDLDWDLSSVVGAKGQAAWEAFVKERKELAAMKERFDSNRIATLQALHQAGVSTRDSAALMDISHQRVHQLINA